MLMLLFKSLIGSKVRSFIEAVSVSLISFKVLDNAEKPQLLNMFLCEN